jgi:hypothetical protein
LITSLISGYKIKIFQWRREKNIRKIVAAAPVFPRCNNKKTVFVMEIRNPSRWSSPLSQDLSKVSRHGLSAFGIQWKYSHYAAIYGTKFNWSLLTSCQQGRSLVKARLFMNAESQIIVKNTQRNLLNWRSRDNHMTASLTFPLITLLLLK